jgi:hypothetical protein
MKDKKLQDKMHGTESATYASRPANEVAHVSHEGAKLSIWFFCGILTLTYGVVLFGQGIYEHFGHQPATVLANLQPTLWWGVLLTLLGSIYTVRFRPARMRS